MRFSRLLSASENLKITYVSIPALTLVILAIAGLAWQLGRRRALSVAGGPAKTPSLHSRPVYFGALTVLWCAIPALLLLGLWALLRGSVVTELVVADLPPELRNLPANELALVVNEIRNQVEGNFVRDDVSPVIVEAAERYRSFDGLGRLVSTVAVPLVALLGLALAWRRISPRVRARNHVEGAILIFIIASSTVAILTTAGIVLSVLFEAFRFFQSVPLFDFLFGIEWSPQTAIRSDQVGASGAFGMIPLFTGTLLISAVAMLVAVPVGLMSAIYLAEYANRRLRSIAKPLLEILAGIPTVVYGFFAALAVAPAIRDAGDALGLEVASQSALAAGLVMGVMIIPFVSSLSDDVINAVPQALREGSLGLGATKSETIRQVVLPAALPGIVGSILLAVSRAIGETMIVVMAAGLAANLTANPLEAVTTVTAQIVTLLVGDQEFDSPKTLAAFALGLVLFLITLALNVIALHVVRRYREQYE